MLMALCLSGSAPAMAQEWQFELTPYMWAAGMKGDIQTTTGGAVDTNAHFSDLLKYLNVGLMGTLEARYDRWMLLLDGIYVKLSDSQSTGRLLWSDVEVDVTQRVYTLAGGYRVLEGATAVDLVGGARYTDLDTEFKLTPGLLPGRNHQLDVNWWDPFAGLRVQQDLGNGFSLMGYADIGGFNVGSKFAWQGILGLNYQFTDNLIGKVGYRYLYTDYDKDGFTYDMGMGGFFLGMGIRF